MNQLQEVLDLSIVFTKPPPGSSPETLAHVVLQCDALGLSHTGEVFTDPLTEAERDDLRWYLEEYWQWPYLEFAERGQRVEALLSDVGRRFYHTLFGGMGAQNIVQVWQQQVNVQHRISIVSEIAGVLRLPWELLADLQGFLVLHAEHPVSMVRRLPKGEQVSLPTPFQLPLRILLVTARPEDAGFVDPRSISRELVDALQRQSEAGMIELEFLRPPTFAALSARLKNSERPIHVLHFDGHGGLGGKEQQGILLFETEAGNPSPVEAKNLAKALKNSGVRLAVLTACQSAMDTQDDALSSVSTQLITNGVDAVIAMSSSILVTSAALYVEAFYHALAEGLPVSIAQAQARQALQGDSHRHLFRRRQDEEATPMTLADWWVPHFYQQGPLTLPATGALRKHAPLPTSTSIRFNGAMPPEPRYHFGGRARELLQIERHLLHQRLVVLSGFGGVGKTALAREAADWLTLTGMYTGACFVSFEHGGDASLLLSTLGTFLGINDGNYTPNNPDAALVKIQSALSARPTLLIADNLESLLPTGDAPLERVARSELWHILRELATLSAGVLLTSRAPLAGEDQLAPGTHVADLHLGGLTSYDAYALATRLLEDLTIPRTRAPYTELRDLLHQLDYHPLAIQLVLPTLRERLLNEIRTDFANLLSHFVDDMAKGRNGSLLASLDYSLSRLTDAQRIWLPRLACFEGGASELELLAITEIPEGEWAELRQALEQATLLIAERIEGLTRPFLHFHPILVPYLRSQQGVEDAPLRERYTIRYAGLANYLYSEDRRHPREIRALVQKELPNLRGALAVLISDGELEVSSVMAHQITYFLTFFGLLRERDDIQRRVGEAIASQGAYRQDTLTYTEYRHESSLGDDEWRLGNIDAASDRFTSLLARIEALPEGAPLGYGSYEHCMTLFWVARCLKSGTQPVKAEGYLRKALVIIDALIIQEPESKLRIGMRGNLFCELADTLRDQGKFIQARDSYEKALELMKQLEDQRGQTVISTQLGGLALEQHNYVEAEIRYKDSIQAFRVLDEPTMEANAWHQLGIVAEHLENWTEAEHYNRESLTIRERLSDAAGSATSCNQLAIVAMHTGRLTEAEGWLKRALDLLNEVNHSGFAQAGTLNNLASLLVSEVQAGYTSTARLAEAKHYAEQALAAQETLDISSGIWRTLSTLARIAEDEGQQELAQTYHRREYETYASFGDNRYHIDRQFGQLIVNIAAVARGDTQAQEAIETALPELEANGWKIAAATRRIWAGERDWQSLIEDMNRESAVLILRVLETIALSEEERT